ncbi:Tf2-6, partial [Mucuna pruriens]
MATSFESFTLLHVPRDQNERVDLLAKLASTQRRGLQWSVIYESLSTPTIDKSEVQHNEGKETWMDPIIECLKSERLPEDSAGSLKIRKEASKYTLIEQRLYRRGFSYPLLRCVDGDEALYIIQEVHEGICGMHIGGRALAGKIARAGYYWPTLKTDCMNYVKKCDKCQRFADWGIDILGPFPIASGQLKFLTVAVDYFTKWIEAEPVATITTERIKRFIWKRIVYRFSLPAEIVQSFTFVEHPQANGQAEAANKVILRGLQRRLEEAKGRWAEELPQVLWSYHTTPHSTTGETPFRLTYGSDAMIPVEIGEPSPRTVLFESAGNEEELRANLDLLQEVQEIAHIKEYTAKARVARRHAQRVICRDFKAQDLVLRKTTQKVENNKLTPNWEGPFRVIENVGRGAYRLEHLDGRSIPRTWNASSLRRFFS